MKAMVAAVDWRKVALVGLLLLAVCWAVAPDAFAAETVDAKAVTGKCKDFPGLTNKVAACIRMTLIDVSSTFFDGFYQLVKRAIEAFTTLVVVVYGVMTAMGMLEKPSRDTLALALKLSMVAWFTTHVDYIYKWDMDMMDAAGSAVVSFVPQSGPVDSNAGITYDQITCLKNMQDKADLKPQEGNPVVGPWLAMDCVIDSVIGLKKDDANAVAQQGVKKWYNDEISGNGLARGLIRFFFSSFQSSAIGALIAVIGFIFIYSMLFLIIKALFTYLGGYIAITFLLIIAPLFIPLVLFRTTKDYFDKWVRTVIGMTLQPIFMLLFITMSVMAMDLTMFSGDYSVMYRIAGDASRQKGFNINTYLDQHQVVKQKPAIAAEIKAEHAPQQCSHLVADPDAGDAPAVRAFVQDPNNANNAQGLENCRAYMLRWWHDSIDWKKLAEARSPAVEPEGDNTPEKQIASEVLSAVIFAGIVIFIMKGLLALVPSIANDLLGDLGISPSLFKQMGVVPGQGQLGSMARDLSGRMGTMVSERLGGPRQ